MYGFFPSVTYSPTSETSMLRNNSSLRSCSDVFACPWLSDRPRIWTCQEGFSRLVAILSIFRVARLTLYKPTVSSCRGRWRIVSKAYYSAEVRLTTSFLEKMKATPVNREFYPTLSYMRVFKLRMKALYALLLAKKVLCFSNPTCPHLSTHFFKNARSGKLRGLLPQHQPYLTQ
jgi:hypothetical protein